MAGQATLTAITIDTNGNAVVNFTYSGGASTDILYLERANSYDAPDKAIVVRRVPRGSLTSVIDYTVSNSGARYWYRIRSTNADGSGTTYSPDWFKVDTECLDVVTVAPYSDLATQTRLNVVQSRSGKRGRETQLMEFAGRKRPAAEVGMMRSQTVDLTWWVETTQEVYDIERILMDNDFWYRDNYGRSFHGSCSDVSESDYIGGYNMSATLTEVDGGATN
ncbi:hypothetical protein CN926_00865 [Bacillus thuringiensis]|uniref:hypothetical protein n=1 Tax=Bacillus thuringiensis TaxID=1428 RepID=UPI000BFCA956|nr:hypothetical protein [Bacillus thuringiensis]PGL88586.1 hypothetical protein CN926_00865 [Bacillus thuringiensis]